MRLKISQIIFCLSSLLLMTGFSWSLHSISLPVKILLVDADTNNAVSNVTVELQWRCGFQGYYWGKSVFQKSDKGGNVIFESKDIPLISEDGYTIRKKPLKKIFVSCILIKEKGYKEVTLMNPKEIDIIKLEKIVS